jgi:predicted metal-dependent hydrolase
VRLFNEGRYFEAHEVLEDAWRAEPGPERRLYQGLLQVGVGLHHGRRGNLRGGRRVLRRGIEALRPFAPRRMGLEVGDLVAGAEAVLALLEGPAGLDGVDWDTPLQARLTAAPDPRH